jgi:predicted aspartyl protease
LALARTRRSFLTSLAGLTVLGGGAVLVRDRLLWPKPPVAFSDGETSGWLPFVSREETAVIVPAEVQGVRVNALVDSGAQFSVIDRSFAERLHLPASFAPPLLAYGVGGAPQVGKGATLDVLAGGLSLKGLKAAMLELGPIAQASGLATPLILGQDLLNEVVADIDFPRRRIRFQAQEGFVVPAEAVEAPSRRKGRALFVQVRAEDAVFEVMLDTGASFALGLTTATAQAEGLLEGRRMTPSRSIVLGGVAAGGVVTLGRVDFGGETLRNVPVHIFEAQPLPGFPAGLLGVGALRSFRTILDHGRGRLLLIR